MTATPLRAASAARLSSVALAVVLLHAALLWLLATQRLRHLESPPSPARATIRVDLLPVPQHAPSEPPPAAAIAERDAARPALPPTLPQRRAPAPAADRSPAAIEAAPAAPLPVIPEPPAPSAIPPSLRIDGDALREAARSSRSELTRRLEADEDRWHGGAAQGASERLAAAIDDAAIPDCLRPDAMKLAPIRLGGLLDLPLLAHAAATGRCR